MINASSWEIPFLGMRERHLKTCKFAVPSCRMSSSAPVFLFEVYVLGLSPIYFIRKANWGDEVAGREKGVFPLS